MNETQVLLASLGIVAAGLAPAAATFAAFKYIFQAQREDANRRDRENAKIIEALSHKVDASTTEARELKEVLSRLLEELKLQREGVSQLVQDVVARLK